MATMSWSRTRAGWILSTATSPRPWSRSASRCPRASRWDSKDRPETRRAPTRKRLHRHVELLGQAHHRPAGVVRLALRGAIADEMDVVRKRVRDKNDRAPCRRHPHPEVRVLAAVLAEGLVQAPDTLPGAPPDGYVRAPDPR